MKKLLLIIFILISKIAIANGIPIVNNLSSSTITTTGCSISFYLDPNGAQTSIWIQYNTTNTSAALNSGPSFQFGTALPGQAGQRNGTITGLLPNTTYYWRVSATNLYGTTNTAAVSFTTLGTLPSINAITSVPNVLTANINYSINANNNITTSYVKYGLTNTTLTSQEIGGNATGTTSTPTTVTLTGLTQNTTYFYQIVATNNSGTTQSSIYSFTTNNILPNSLVAEYTFDNTMQNTNGSNPFSSNSGTSFTTNRNGNANAALNITNTGSTATILELPYGNSPRTISFWVKLNVMQTPYNMTFSYGTGSGSAANGGSFNSSVVEYFGYMNNATVNNSNNASTWYHFVYTYDGTIARIFKNGVSLLSQPKTWNTLNNSNIFKLGTGVGGELTFDGAIDDLKIYNYVISDAEIINLYNNNSLGSQNFNSNNLKATIYPNPTTDTFTIETENDIKSVEIYSIQGQKVLISNSKNINVSNLSKGMYMVRIEDSNNAIATQKLVVK